MLWLDALKIMGSPPFAEAAFPIEPLYYKLHDFKKLAAGGVLVLSKRKAARANPRRPTDVPLKPSSPAELESTTSPTSDTTSSAPSCRLPAISLESTETLSFAGFLGGGCPSLRQDYSPATETTNRSRPLPKPLFSEWLEPEGDRRYNFDGQDSPPMPTCNLDSGLAFGFSEMDGAPSGAGAETSCKFAEMEGQFGNDVDLLTEEGLYDLLYGEDLFSKIAVNGHDVIYY